MKYLSLLLLLVACNSRQPVPEITPQVDTSAILSAYRFELFREMSDSLNAQIGKGYHYMAVGQKDSIFRVAGRADVYQQLENQFSK